MAKNLSDVLTEERYDAMVLAPTFQDGDYLTYFFKKDRAYEDRVDGLVTLYRSMKTKELVGCKIKGVRKILRELGSYGFQSVIIREGKVLLGFLFIGAGLVNPERADSYKEASRRFGDVPIDSSELPSLATAV